LLDQPQARNLDNLCSNLRSADQV